MASPQVRRSTARKKFCDTLDEILPADDMIAARCNDRDFGTSRWQLVYRLLHNCDARNGQEYRPPSPRPSQEISAKPWTLTNEPFWGCGRDNPIIHLDSKFIRRYVIVRLGFLA